MKTIQRLVLTALVAMFVAVFPALAQDHEERTLTLERHGRGHCPQLLKVVGKDSPRIMRLGNFGYLGVEATALTPELRAHFGVPRDLGVMVGRVEEDSPALAAGLEVGDIITRLDDEEVTSGGNLQRLVRRHEKGDEVTLEYWRDGQAQTATLAIGEHQRCGFDISRVIDLKNLPHVELENFRVDIENLPKLERFKNLPTELFPRLAPLMELHELDGEDMEETRKQLREMLKSQDWQSHLERIRDVDLSEIEERLEKAMDRLHELESHIDMEKKRVRPSTDEEDDQV